MNTQTQKETGERIPPRNQWNVERGVYGLNISTMFHGHRIHRNYIGYPKREALKLFRAYLKAIQP